MARIRSIHPGLFTDEAIVVLSPMARFLFIGILTECDDGGIFEWKPISLKMRLLPADNVDMAALLSELADANVVRRYCAEGREYGAVRNFCRFQRPKKPKLTHPMPAELRTYVASDAASSEPEDDEGGPSSPPTPRQPKRVPQKSENAPQMEDGGGSRRRESNPEPAAPLDPAPAAAAAKRREFTTDGPTDEFRETQAACIAALGDIAPADAHFGPMMLLVDRGFPLRSVVTVLRSFAAKPPRNPVKTWSLWAQKVSEHLASAPKGEPPARTVLIRDVEVPEYRVKANVDRFYVDGVWPELWGPPPGAFGCCIPSRFLKPKVDA
jgi:hypothetical protein